MLSYFIITAKIRQGFFTKKLQKNPLVSILYEASGYIYLY